MSLLTDIENCRQAIGGFLGVCLNLNCLDSPTVGI